MRAGLLRSCYRGISSATENVCIIHYGQDVWGVFIQTPPTQVKSLQHQCVKQHLQQEASHCESVDQSVTFRRKSPVLGLKITMLKSVKNLHAETVTT